MEEFAKIYSLIEISKGNISELEQYVKNLPIYKELEETDEYLNKYLPISTQNMIHDTLTNCLNEYELNKLALYEQVTFKNL